jgi:hypothetical protein
VVAEIALGHLRQRALVIESLLVLPRSDAVTNTNCWSSSRRTRCGRGIGLVDAHLLAAFVLTAEALLWARDKRLHSVAIDMGVAAGLP